MKIAIHHSPGSFSNRWIKYCEVNQIDFKLVDAYSNDIIEQLKGCDAFIWNHFSHRYKDTLFAKQLLYSLEMSGMRVFPDFKTTWYYDDKIGQKYLLEAISANLVKTYVFYTKEDALDWARSTTFPKVFKLTKGAASVNVKLVKTQDEAFRIIHKAFGKGFRQNDVFNKLKERYHIFRLKKKSVLWLIKGLYYIFYKDEFSSLFPKEKGYVYFQDFIPDNSYDIRIIVIGDKAFGIKRYNRENDFRASGSGNITYDYQEIDRSCITQSFEICERLSAQCLAFDYVFNNNQPLLVEVSYGFLPQGYDKCQGYWDKNINWVPGAFNPYGWMIENLIKG